MNPEALTVIGTGIALAVLNVGLVTWLRLDMKTAWAEAAAGWRALQAGMYDFRHTM